MRHVWNVFLRMHEFKMKRYKMPPEASYSTTMTPPAECA